MKLVLINGLRIKPIHCNTLKLKQLLQNKGILFKQKDKDKTLLKKLKDNIIAVSVHEIHDILNFPAEIQKQKDEEIQRILGKTPSHVDKEMVLISKKIEVVEEAVKNSHSTTISSTNSGFYENSHSLTAVQNNGPEMVNNDVSGSISSVKTKTSNISDIQSVLNQL